MIIVYKLPSLVSLVDEVVYILVGGYCELAEVLHVRSEGGVLAHTQIALILGVQQIADAFAVYLHVRYFHLSQLNKDPFKLIFNQNHSISNI